MVMYYIIFTEIRTDTNIENRWMFISSAIFLFHFLARSITGGSGVFISRAGMIKKMYFPREILVLAYVINSMIVCIIGISIVLIMLVVTNNIDVICLLTLIPLLFLSFVFAVGCVFLLSSIAVYVRDIQYALSTLAIALFIMTPMRYMASDATGILSTLIWYNPLTYYVEWVHDILYWCVLPDYKYVIMCAIISLVMLIIGYVTFYKLKDGFVRRL